MTREKTLNPCRNVLLNLSDVKNKRAYLFNFVKFFSLRIFKGNTTKNSLFYRCCMCTKSRHVRQIHRYQILK
ncbi:hypothetical protein HanRHA438_Chr14g0660591 [Helianthus annuus]|nr:hypothetical protein HanRHA438_Chr14g0660591 [Helianthus annuus]